MKKKRKSSFSCKFFFSVHILASFSYIAYKAKYNNDGSGHHHDDDHHHWHCVCSLFFLLSLEWQSLLLCLFVRCTVEIIYNKVPSALLLLTFLLFNSIFYSILLCFLFYLFFFFFIYLFIERRPPKANQPKPLFRSPSAQHNRELLNVIDDGTTLNASDASNEVHHYSFKPSQQIVSSEFSWFPFASFIFCFYNKKKVNCSFVYRN